MWVAAGRPGGGAIDEATRNALEQGLRDDLSEAGEGVVLAAWCSVDLPGALPMDGWVALTARRWRRVSLWRDNR